MVEDDSTEGSRPATLKDLIKLCHELNQRDARYVIIGGTAMLNLGFARATEDIDLLVARGVDEEKKILDAVATLEDGVAREIQPGEIEQYQVIRVADEIVVDLMSKASGLSYEEAAGEIEYREIEGVRIPFASAELMLKLKQGIREKDKMDLDYLEKLLRSRGK